MIGEIIGEAIDPSISVNYQLIENKRKINENSCANSCAGQEKSWRFDFGLGSGSMQFKYILPIATALTICFIVMRK